MNEPIIDRRREKTIHAKPNSLDLPGNESLNVSTLQCPEIGENRVKKYFRKYYIEDPYSTKPRSEKECPLTKILTTKKTESRSKVNGSSEIVPG